MKMYCYNVVIFDGEKSQEVLSHFRQIPQNSPPFEAILVANNKLYFDSNLFPPLQDLSEIAEKFDVNYTLDCSSDGEKSSYNYICRQQHKLPKKSEEIRQAINNSSSLDDLLKIDNSLQRITYSGELDNHQFFVLKQISGKKYRELNRETEKENQEEVRRNRSR